jgi:hypothetical protein
MLKTKCKQFYLVSIVVCFTATVCAYGTNDFKDGISFDLNWWKQAVPGEQEGFILGYLDCRRSKVVVGSSVSDYRVYVDNAMEPKHGPRPKYVTEAIAQRWLTFKSSVPKQGGESDPPNGLSWADDAWNRGYVEGFMQCYSIVASKSLVDLYTSDIDHHYASTDRVNDPLADVLNALLLKRKILPRTHY